MWNRFTAKPSLRLQNSNVAWAEGRPLVGRALERGYWSCVWTAGHCVCLHFMFKCRRLEDLSVSRRRAVQVKSCFGATPLRLWIFSKRKGEPWLGQSGRLPGEGDPWAGLLGCVDYRGPQGGRAPLEGNLLGAGHRETWTRLNQRIYLVGRKSKLSEADQEVSFSKREKGKSAKPHQVPREISCL